MDENKDKYRGLAMKIENMRKLSREVKGLSLLDEASQQKSQRRHVVVSPTVTRRPALDAMLGDMQVVAQHNLEQMRNKALNGVYLGREELKQFIEISQMVLRQTRTEMEVERHVEARVKGQTDKELAIAIAQKLQTKGIDNEVIIDVLEELGLDNE